MTAVIECWLCRDHPQGQQTCFSETTANAWRQRGYEVTALVKIGEMVQVSCASCPSIDKAAREIGNRGEA